MSFVMPFFLKLNFNISKLGYCSVRDIENKKVMLIKVLLSPQLNKYEMKCYDLAVMKAILAIVVALTNAGKYKLSSKCYLLTASLAGTVSIFFRANGTFL